MGYFNIEVSDNGEEIKIYRRRMTGKELLFDFKISDVKSKEEVIEEGTTKIRINGKLTDIPYKKFAKSQESEVKG